MVGSLFSSINNPSRIDKLLDESALFKDSKNASLEGSNLNVIEKNILSAKEGRKAVRFLDASLSASNPQPDFSQLSSANSILSASNFGLLSSLSDGPFDSGFGRNSFGGNSFGFGSNSFGGNGFGANPFGTNIFSALI